MRELEKYIEELGYTKEFFSEDDNLLEDLVFALEKQKAEIEELKE